ncbi:MAG: alginate export family protein [Candidatus Hydrogenedentes bacterium]|nr:alginate export family protein [Candidatus Hydrogenedentota bacterium]
MRRVAFMALLGLLILATVSAVAELQQVSVGGSVRIRGNYVSNELTGPLPQPRWLPPLLGGRPIGGPFNPAVASIYHWDNDGPDYSSVEMRTRLHVRADFTDDVSTFIEVDSYDNWGEDFRSNYITGVDGRAATGDDVEIFQAYIEARDLWDSPLSLRIGRQELAFGSQWLVGPRDFGFFFTGISFDALRLTYAADTFTVDAWASKLAERFSDFGDADVDFYGLYGSYTGIEGHTLDAYWMMLRDDTGIEDVAGGPVTEWIEDLWGVDDYGATTLHTAGVRAAGKFGAFDYDAEVAYQFGEADAIGTTFKPGLYGDDDADFDNLGAKLELGYAFDAAWHPRVFTAFRYYGGEDNRDISFWEWLNPFDKPEASINFNRLFSNDILSGFIDANNDFTNAWYARVGLMTAPTEKLRTMFWVSYYESLEDFDAPRHFTLGKMRIPILPGASWWTQANDDDLGIDVMLALTYLYSQDLSFDIGWTHLFTGDGYAQGNYNSFNGLVFNGGSDDDDADYVFAGCRVDF